MAPELDILTAGLTGHRLRALWPLDADCHFLNHGSYGATPYFVLQAQNTWRMQMERQPVQFMCTDLPLALRGAARHLATFLETEHNRLAFAENASAGINAILRSVHWRRGDEIVIANHAYQAVRNTVDFLTEQFGIGVRLATIAFPVLATEDIAHSYCDVITSKTRIAIVDHVFSPLAVITPLEAIIQHCRNRGVCMLVDGAHGPGMLALNLDSLGVDWYVGNCHKWLCAPKGCAFIHKGRNTATEVHPAVISNFYRTGYTQEFDWQGTRDYSAWLSVSASIEFLQTFGVQRYQKFLADQASEAAHMLCQHWQVELPAPPLAFAAMVTLLWPRPEPGTLENAKRLRAWLWATHRIEVPIIVINGKLWLRISAQIYNQMSDYEALAQALLPD
jgi:isopenicillin-N epimerase